MKIIFFRKKLLLFLVTINLFFGISITNAQQCPPAGLPVTTLSDPAPGQPGFAGAGTLRWAINEANKCPDVNYITFNVQGELILNSSLPNITSRIEIDGATAVGTRLILNVNGYSNALYFYTGSNGSTVKNIEIIKFYIASIYSYSNDMTIFNNIIRETIRKGTYAISGIFFYRGNYNIIKGNIIENVDYGIYLSADRGDITTNTIGGTASGDANTIRNNIINGLRLTKSYPYKNNKNKISGNILYNNSKSIRLFSGGNDNKPIPIIASAIISEGVVTIQGTTTSNMDQVEVFESDAAGKFVNAYRYLGTATANSSGQWSLSLANTGPDPLAINDYVIATATNIDNNTSELSDVRIICSEEGSLSAAPNPVQKLESAEITYTGPGGISHNINFGDGSATISGGAISNGTVFTHIYANLGTYTVTLNVINNSCTEVSTVPIQVKQINCCANNFPVPEINTKPLSQVGEFYIDENTGEFLYQAKTCPALIPFSCLSSQRVIGSTNGVISASAVTYKDEWNYDASIYPSKKPAFTSSANIFEKGEANKWRVEKQFVHRQPLDQPIKNTVVSDDYKNYDRGTFSLSMFDWKHENNNDVNKWVMTTQMNAYTPNGNPAEDENILGIKSTASYGYNQTLPILVAQNAAQNSVSYESFENLYNTPSGIKLENALIWDISNGERVSAFVHTGKHSVQLKAPVNGGAFVASEVTISPQILQEGVIVRAWLRVNKNKPELITSTQNNIQIFFRNLNLSSNWHGTKINMAKVSDAGEWTLYEAIILPSNLNSASFAANHKMRIGIHIKGWGTGALYYAPGDIHLDDVRVQPLSAEMVTYVYDRAQRLTASFDDQHYALIYQYNAEGNLVRKLKETVKGVKTISENQNNTKGKIQWKP